MFHHKPCEFLVFVADVCWKVVDFLAEVLPQAHVLIELMRKFEDGAIHDAYVVDGMRLHGVDDDREVNRPDDDVIMLEDEHKLMRNLLHDILDILSKPVSFLPLLNDNPMVLLILLLQSLLKTKIIVLLLCRDNAAFELAATGFYDFGPIADDKDRGVIEGRFFLDAGDGLIYHFCGRVGSNRTCCDDDCPVQRGLFDV